LNGCPDLGFDLDASQFDDSLKLIDDEPHGPVGRLLGGQLLEPVKCVHKEHGVFALILRHAEPHAPFAIGWAKFQFGPDF
jgi:hypothetical protein